jgi:hypothetical protein
LDIRSKGEEIPQLENKENGRNERRCCEHLLNVKGFQYYRVVQKL